MSSSTNHYLIFQQDQWSQHEWNGDTNQCFVLSVINDDALPKESKPINDIRLFTLTLVFFKYCRHLEFMIVSLVFESYLTSLLITLRAFTRQTNEQRGQYQHISIACLIIWWRYGNGTVFMKTFRIFISEIPLKSHIWYCVVLLEDWFTFQDYYV